MIHEFKKMASWTTIGHIFFIRSISFSFFNPSHQNHFLIKFCRRLKRLMSKMLWFACVRPFFHPFCLHICKYVQHSDGHCRLKKCPKFALPWATFWPLLVRYDVKTEELKDHMVISVSNWGIRFSSNKGIKVRRSRNKIVKPFYLDGSDINTWNLKSKFKFQVFLIGQDRKTTSFVHYLGDVTAR